MSTDIPEYSSFAELAKSHLEGRDFRRVIKHVNGARVAIIAPHGGRIEPHTDEIAGVLAGQDFSMYTFTSLLPSRAANLHITSHRFDDPDCLELIRRHEYVVAVHGWGAQDEAILIGGLDTTLGDDLIQNAAPLGVATYKGDGSLSGTHPRNICNRGASGRGVQIELTMALRRGQSLPALLASFRAVLLRRQNAA